MENQNTTKESDYLMCLDTKNNLYGRVESIFTIRNFEQKNKNECCEYDIEQ